VNPGSDFYDRLAEMKKMALVLHPAQHRILKEMPFVHDFDPVDHMAL
jgi:hypothetical protein